MNIKIDADDINYEEDLITKTAWEKFGIKYLYPWQRMVISNIIEAYEYQRALNQLTEEERHKNEDENSDSFCKGRQIVLLPTGAGKSLCFQVPAAILKGPSLVIYPLLALMADQQRRMEQGNLGCVVFKGGMSKEEWNNNFEKIKQGAKIILANPEILKNKNLIQKLKACNICHLAIDEAHTSAAWGDTFRPAYLELGNVIKELNPPVITAFTATASPELLSRVSEILFGGQAHIVRSESDRQNIHYFVKYAAAKKKEALFLAHTEEKPMIIFCGTRGKAEDMARELNMFYGADIARFYHAGLEKSEKDEVEKWFYESKTGILAATCAYGMGIDKPDIKTIVHLEASESAEAYIQEAGRGGRNGDIAKAFLIWSLEDSLKFSQFKDGSRQKALKIFAETKDCRRQVLLDSLGAEKAVCSGCDICNQRNSVKKVKKLKEDYTLAFNLIKNYNRCLSFETACMLLKEKMNERFIKLLGIQAWNIQDSMEVFTQLKNKGRIQECGPLWKNKLKIKKPNP